MFEPIVPDMTIVPAGRAWIGSADADPDAKPNEHPAAWVDLPAFAIARTPVTVEEFTRFVQAGGARPRRSWGGDRPPAGYGRHPAVNIGWDDADAYCAWLARHTGLAFRLPSEAEWECAARAGTTTRFSYGDDTNYTRLADHAWYGINGNLTAHPVGQKLPNPWGLYDIEGNVWEWCLDWYGSSLPGGTVTDPLGPGPSALGWKVMRGGAYDFWTTDSRSAKRGFFHPALNDSDLGFRIVLVSD